MATNKHNPIVEVYEYRKVKYRKHDFFFFNWFEKISATKLNCDIFIQTNEPIDKVFLNDEILLSNQTQTVSKE